MIKMIRKTVAGPKNRTVQGQFDLDLTHITDRFIAMAFPASGFQKTYRNPIQDVSAYLNKHFQEHYLVINLSMRKYDYSHFGNRVKDYFWPDHKAPPLPTMMVVCRDMYNFLVENPKNVIVVHCNHGKGRTGTSIVAFFLYTGFYKRPESALRFYNRRRFQGHKYAVDQPCQTRYLNYLTDILYGQKEIPPRMVAYKLVNYHLEGIQKNSFLRITSVRFDEVRYDQLYPHGSKFESKHLMADIFIQIRQPTLFGDIEMCRANVNLFFLPPANEQTKIHRLVLKGDEIKINTKHDSNFSITLDFEEFCQCHKIPQDKALNLSCECFSDRNIQDKCWQTLIVLKNKSNQIDGTQAIKLIFKQLDQKQFDDMVDA